MNNILPTKYLHDLKILDIAFQPIIDVNSGELYAVEALLRNTQDIGFKSIFAFFDYIYKENLLYSFDIMLRKKAFTKFTTIKNYENIKLFYNLDNRILEMENYSNGNTNKLLAKLGLKKEQLCFEISERHKFSTVNKIENILKHYRDDDFLIAIDDFGSGYAGYQLLYDATPHVIKIDRYFIQDIDSDLKKKILLKSIVNLSLQLGIKVIAEGVETQDEFLVCKEVGCHFIQGYFIQRPTLNTQEIHNDYKSSMDSLYKREKSSNSKLKQYTEKIEPILVDTKMKNVIKYFKKNKNIRSIPVVNASMEPVGIFHDYQIKEFIYSPYGMSLLLNDSEKHSKLKNMVQYCGYTDIDNDIATVIELFSNNPESIGIILTKDTKYYGFLSSSAIINILNEENILIARDQNPLTRLPGNRIIDQYLYKATKSASEYLLCYFDLDNFKAFNDVYGFRNGDRVIQLFADMMRIELPNKFFKAHIGGDDFFCAIESDLNTARDDIESIIEKFKNNAEEFYSQEDKENGYIISTGRENNKRKFPLVTVSASVLFLRNKTKNRNLNNLNAVLSSQKKVAKDEINHLAISTLL